MTSFRDSLKTAACRRKNCQSLFAVLGKNLESLGILATKSLVGGGNSGDKYRPQRRTTTTAVSGETVSSSSASIVTAAVAVESKTVLSRFSTKKTITITSSGGGSRKVTGSAGSSRSGGGGRGDRRVGNGVAVRSAVTASRPCSGSRSAASPAAKQVGGKAAVKLKPKSGRFAQATKERRPLFFTSIGTDVLVTVYRKEWGVILKVMLTI